MNDCEATGGICRDGQNCLEGEDRIRSACGDRGQACCVAGNACPDADGDGICDNEDGLCEIDGMPLTCRRAQPNCPEGKVPEVVMGCFTNACVDWAECAAAVAGGPNIPPGQACGSRGLDPCPGGQFCNFPENANCGRTDRPGACMEIPVPCPRILRPVCGCNGMDYANDCIAHAASTSVDYQGECMPEGCNEGEIEAEGECHPACMGNNDCDEPLTCNAAEVCLPAPNVPPGGNAPAVCYGWCGRHP
jgi:hypothetical protein